MSPIHAVENSAELLKEINRRVHFLSLEIDSNSEQWNGLGRVGGQREDHAAQLMARLRPILSDLSAFCTRVERQIDGMVADPFGRNSAA